MLDLSNLIGVIMFECLASFEKFPDHGVIIEYKIYASDLEISLLLLVPAIWYKLFPLLHDDIPELLASRFL